MPIYELTHPKTGKLISIEGSVPPTEQELDNIIKQTTPIVPNTSRVKDVAISALKGVVGIPEMAVGLADIPTGGLVGKTLEDATGTNFNKIKQNIEDYAGGYSPEQQEANLNVEKAKGFFPTVGAMLENPSTIGHGIVESLPSMVAGGGLGRVAAKGIMKGANALATKGVLKTLPVALPEIAATIGAGAGEGLVTAGTIAEQVRQNTTDGRLTPTQAGLSLLGGVTTGAIGGVSGKVASKLGIEDIDVAMARGKLLNKGAEGTLPEKSILKAMGKGAIAEGALEEMPQSYQEQITQNLAEGKPWDEGASEAAAQGLVTGSVMGAGIAGGGATRSKLFNKVVDTLDKQDQEKLEAVEKKRIEELTATAISEINQKAATPETLAQLQELKNSPLVDQEQVDKLIGKATPLVKKQNDTAIKDEETAIKKEDKNKQALYDLEKENIELERKRNEIDIKKEKLNVKGEGALGVLQRAALKQDIALSEQAVDLEARRLVEKFYSLDLPQQQPIEQPVQESIVEPIATESIQEQAIVTPSQEILGQNQSPTGDVESVPLASIDGETGRLSNIDDIVSQEEVNHPAIQSATNGLNNRGSIQVAPEYMVKAVKAIYQSVKTFAEFSKKLIAEFGETIKSHALKLWNYVKNIQIGLTTESVDDEGNRVPIGNIFKGKQDKPAISTKTEQGNLDISGSSKKSPYFQKDKAKFSKANKFIGRGSSESSTQAYANTLGNKANSGVYSFDDIVGISSEGNRSNRIKPDFKEIQKAIDAGSTIITDTIADRNRSYNVGEREVAEYLVANGYKETSDGTWSKTPTKKETPKEESAAEKFKRELAERDTSTHRKDVIPTNVFYMGKTEGRDDSPKRLMVNTKVALDLIDKAMSNPKESYNFTDIRDFRTKQLRPMTKEELGLLHSFRTSLPQNLTFGSDKSTGFKAPSTKRNTDKLSDKLMDSIEAHEELKPDTKIHNGASKVYLAWKKEKQRLELELAIALDSQEDAHLIEEKYKLAEIDKEAQARRDLNAKEVKDAELQVHPKDYPNPSKTVKGKDKAKEAYATKYTDEQADAVETGMDVRNEEGEGQVESFTRVGAGVRKPSKLEFLDKDVYIKPYDTTRSEKYKTSVGILRQQIANNKLAFKGEYASFARKMLIDLFDKYDPIGVIKFIEREEDNTFDKMAEFPSSLVALHLEEFSAYGPMPLEGEEVIDSSVYFNRYNNLPKLPKPSALLSELGIKERLPISIADTRKLISELPVAVREKLYERIAARNKALTKEQRIENKQKLYEAWEKNSQTIQEQTKEALTVLAAIENLRFQQFKGEGLVSAISTKTGIARDKVASIIRSFRLIDKDNDVRWRIQNTIDNLVTSGLLPNLQDIIGKARKEYPDVAAPVAIENFATDLVASITNKVNSFGDIDPRSDESVVRTHEFVATPDMVAFGMLAYSNKERDYDVSSVTDINRELTPLGESPVVYAAGKLSVSDNVIDLVNRKVKEEGSYNEEGFDTRIYVETDILFQDIASKTYIPNLIRVASTLGVIDVETITARFKEAKNEYFKAKKGIDTRIEFGKEPFKADLDKMQEALREIAKISFELKKPIVKDRINKANIIDKALVKQLAEQFGKEPYEVFDIASANQFDVSRIYSSLIADQKVKEQEAADLERAKIQWVQGKADTKKSQTDLEKLVEGYLKNNKLPNMTSNELYELINDKSLATVKEESGVQVTPEDVFTMGSLLKLPNNETIMVGKLIDKTSQGVMEKIASIFGADVVFVRGNYKSEYVPVGKDGRPKIVVNVDQGISINHVFAHELFHHIVNKVSKEQYAKFQEAIMNHVNEDKYRQLLEKMQRKYFSEMSIDDVITITSDTINVKQGADTAFDKRKTGITAVIPQAKIKLTIAKNKVNPKILEQVKEELHAEIFAEVFKDSAFWSELANSSYEGKTLAHKMFTHLLNTFKNIVNALKGLTNSQKKNFEIRQLITSWGDSNGIYKLMSDLAKDAMNENKVRGNTIKHFSPVDFLNDVKEHSLLKPVVQEAKTNYGWIGDKLGAIWKDLKEKFMKFAAASLGAPPEVQRIMYTIANAHRLTLEKERGRMETKYKDMFKGMTNDQHIKIQDLVRTLNQGNPEERTKALDELMGIENGKVWEFLQDSNEMTKKLYKQLRKFYPDMGYLPYHFGQHLSWYRMGGKIENGFDSIVEDLEKSKLKGKGEAATKTQSEQLPSKMIAEGWILEYANPYQVYMNYVSNTAKLVTLHEMMKKAKETGLAIEVQKGDKLPKEKRDWASLDDNALKLVNGVELDRGYKILTGKDSEGIPTYHSSEGTDYVFTTQEDAKRFVEDNKEEFVGKSPAIEEVSRDIEAETKGFIIEQTKRDGSVRKMNFKTREDVDAFLEDTRTKMEEKYDKASPSKIDLWMSNYKVVPQVKEKRVELRHTGNIYLPPSFARMLRAYLSTDNIRSSAIGRNIAELKNEYTAWELGMSAFHLITMGMELTSSFASNAITNKDNRFLSKIPLANMFGKNGAIGSNNAINRVYDDIIKNFDNEEYFDKNGNLIHKESIESLTKYLGKDVAENFVDVMNNYTLSGGIREQDHTLRAGKHITDVDFKLKTFRKSIMQFYALERKNNPSFIGATYHTGRYIALNSTTGWLFEHFIPRIKFAQFAREYATAVVANKEALANGTVTKQDLAIQVNKFIEERFGEMNWENLWMDKTLSGVLKLFFRSFTWVYGTQKALFGSMSDLVRLGIVKPIKHIIKGERPEFEITQRGMWALTAIASHVMATVALTVVCTGELPHDDEDDDTNWITKLLFPQVSKSDPTKRISLPSYVTEFWKTYMHLMPEIVGGHFEPSKMVVGRFNGVVSKTTELLKNQDFEGVYVYDSADGPIGMSWDIIKHMMPVPISFKTMADDYKTDNLNPKGIVTGFMGFTDAPSIARRDAATIKAFNLSRREYLGKEIGHEEAKNRLEIKKMKVALERGDTAKMDSMVQSGEISNRKRENELKKVRMIGTTANPKYVKELERVVKQRLGLENSLKVYEKATDKQKKELEPIIREKYNNLRSQSTKSPKQKLELLKLMNTSGIRV